MSRMIFIIAMVAAPAACLEDFDHGQCMSTSDCDQGVCLRGFCRTAIGSLHGTEVDAADPSYDARATDGAAPARQPGPCSGAARATVDNVVLNEVLANPPSGLEGDANGDGVRDPYDDEFVELVNVSDTHVEMEGVSIYVGGRLKYWFEPLCLHPRMGVVVFGGGSIGPTIRSAAVVSDVRFGMANDGGVVRIVGPEGLIDEHSYSHAGPQSWTLAPDLTGRWAKHHEVAPHPHSAGVCADGRDFQAGCGVEPPENDVGGDARSYDGGGAGPPDAG